VVLDIIRTITKVEVVAVLGQWVLMHDQIGQDL